MAVSQWPFLAAVLLLVSQGLQCSLALSTCPVPCLCQRGPLLNCSSSGLSTAPGHIQATVTELDLSQNLLNSLTLRRPNQNLRNLWLGNNSITHLSLCMERTVTSQDVKRAGPRPSRPWSRRGCLSWAPALQLLSVERNQLVQLPKGLGGSKSLQVLQLSYNRISTLRPGDLSSLLQLRELHLQHNHLTNLHPQTFKDLSQLRVLDLSFNLFTTLPPSTYLALRNLEAEVDLRGNRWQCDCSMRSVRRWMFYDRDRGQPAWRVVCASPSALSGRDLQQLEEGDLTCFTADNGPGLHQDVTVDEGSEILLPCSSTHKDSTWWTPNGQVSVSQSEAGLLIRDITERDTGLYACMSESQQELLSVFNLLIRKTGETQKKTRSPRSSPWGSQLVIPRQGILDRVAQVRNQTTTQSDLALAVSLSVIFTFLVAFILGVLARPLIDILWRRICTKKTVSATYSVSSEGQGPYDNEGYSVGEEPEEIGAHRERRVTFTTVDFREHSQASNSNVPYYDTVASVNQESTREGALKESGAMYVKVQEGCSSLSSSEAEPEKKTPKAGDSDSGSSSQQGSPEEHQRGKKGLPHVTHPGPTHSMEFEHIPDPDDLGERRSSSSHSETEQMAPKNLLKPQSTQRVEDTIQQRSQSPTVEVTQITIDGRSEIPGFTSEPFADWPPNTNDSEIWNDSGESFEFSDSFQGVSPRSSNLLGSLDHLKQICIPPSDNQKHPDSSSSSSTLSDDEQTHYTVNPEEDEDIEASQNTQFTHDNKPEIVNPYLTQDVSFEQGIPSEDPFKPSVREEGFHQGDSRQETQSPPMGPGHSNSSSSSDSDDEPTEYTVNEDSNKEKEEEEKLSMSDKSASIMVTTERDRTEEINPAPWTDVEPKAKQPDLTLGVPSIKKKQKAPLPPAAVSSSSSSESDAETTDYTVKQNWDGAKVGITSQEPETKWPDPGPRSIPKIKRRLDIKAPSPPPNTSSSSESEDETKDKSVKQERREVDMTGITLKESQFCTSQRPETRWPDPGLSSVPSIKRHLDIKAPSPPPKSSSSSSEDETTDHKVKWGGEEAKVPETTYKQPLNSPVLLPPKRTVKIKSDSSASSADEREERARQDLSSFSTKVDPEPGSKWPDLGLITVPRIKRRLDIKAPSLPHSESSSSSESDDESKDHTVKQERDRIDVGITSREPETKWPDLGPQSIPKIKRHLDIKAPSPPPNTSSSSSESEDETTDKSIKQERGEVDMSGITLNESQITSQRTETRWPELDLSSVPSIKRHLDIKAPSPPPADLSSSSECKDGTADPTVRQQREEAKDPTVPHSEQTLGVGGINVPLAPKISFDNSAAPGPLPAESSSSSSESDDENKSRTVKLEGEVVVEKTPAKDSLTPTAQEIKLENEANITNEKEKTWAVNTSPAPKVNQETRWAGLGLSIPRFKKRLDITSPKDAPPKVPTTPPPTSSSSSSESGDERKDPRMSQKKGGAELQGITYKESSLNPVDKPMNVSLTLKSADNIYSDNSAEVEESPPAVPSPRPPDSSSSSESEDETSRNKGFGERAEVPDFPMTEAKPHPGSMWTGLGVPCIKRRLDIKILEEAPPAVSSPRPPDSSSSSESEDETSRNKGLGERAEVPDFPTTEAKPHPGSMWTGLGVPCIKRRLDIKILEEAPPAVSSPRPPDSSSSSESEDETSRSKGFGERAEVPDFPKTEVKPHPGSMWAGLGVPQIRRRLDIKIPEEAPPALPAPQPPASSSSSESEDETSGHTGKGFEERAKVPGFPTTEVKPDPGSMWVSLGVPRIKRRLDIKIPEEAPPAVTTPQPPDFSSSCKSEDDTTDCTGKGLTERAEVPVVMHKESLQSPNSLYSKRIVYINFDQSESSPTPRVEREHESKCPDLGLSRVPRINKRLDIKAPSPPQSKSSSSSESEGETIGQMVRQEKDRTNVGFASREPETKRSDLGLHSIPKIKRHLDIKGPSPPKIKSSSSSESDGEKTSQTVRHEKDRADVGAASRGPETKWSDLGLHSIPKMKRHLDIKGPSPPKIKSSSSSESEGEKTSQMVRHEKDRADVGFASREPETKWPDLDLQNIPHIKRRLDIKAPSPPPPPPPPLADSPSSSSNSEDEMKDHTVKLGKRESEKLIGTGKDPPLSVGGIKVSLAQRRALNISFDDVVKRRVEHNKHTPDVDLAPELKWKGIGRYSQSAIRTSEESRAVESALSTSSLRRQVDVDIKPTQEAPPTVPGDPSCAPSSSSSSSSESGDEIEPDGQEKAKITLSHDYSSISPVGISLTPRRAPDIKFDNSSTSTDVTDWRTRSEDRRQRRGLTALKAMSSERQTWDTAQEELQRGSYSVRQDQSISYQTSERDLKSLAKLSAPERPLSTISTDETRVVGSPHRISRLRRRAVVVFQPSQETPPPVPGTAPPAEEEAAGSTWRSPQSSVKQDWGGMGSYQQREMSVDGYVHSSMSSVSRRDGGPSLIGLMGATPYHPHTAPKRYQSVTPSATTQILRIDREESNTSSTVSKNPSLFDYSNSITDV